MSVKTPSMWWSGRAIGLHITLFITVPGFFALGWWQLHRALGGNGLIWAYTFEWPFFAGYAVYLWWRLVHEPEVDATPKRTIAADETQAGGEDAALSAYNAYLASLHEEDKKNG